MPDYSYTEDGLFACFAGTFKVQSDIKTALATNLINKRHPLIQPSKPQQTRNRRIVYHCNNIDIFEEKISDQVSRWTFAFPADAQLITGWMAMNYGSALAPTGTPQNEVQTISNPDADDNSYALKLDYEGRSYTTRLIAFDATAAEVKTALEALDNIEVGDITSVTGTLVAGLVVTFGGKLGKADVVALQVVNNTVSAGTITVTETTKGANKVHAIARSASVNLPTTSFIIGFEEQTIFQEHKGFACDAITIDAQNREDLGCTVELIGRADTDEVLEFVVPNCVTVNPIEVNDCRLVVDGDFLVEDLASFRFERKNNIPVGSGAFPWADKNIGLLWRVKPTELFTIGFYGSDEHPTHGKAKAEEKVPLKAHLGIPGNRYTINAPNTKLKLADQDLTFDNDLKRSVVNILGQPYFDNTLAASSNGVGILDQTTAFLLTS